MKIIEKIEKGHYNLGEFTEDQREYIIALVKMSYNEGVTDGKKDVEDRIWRVLNNDNGL